MIKPVLKSRFFYVPDNHWSIILKENAIKFINLQQRIKNLSQHTVLKKITCIFILCMFLLSITPKQVLHFLAADHQDQPCKKINDRLQLNATGFNCDCDSIVATSPFTDADVVPEIDHTEYFAAAVEHACTPLAYTEANYFNLRGPPATV